MQGRLAVLATAVFLSFSPAPQLSDQTSGSVLHNLSALVFNPGGTLTRWSYRDDRHRPRDSRYWRDKRFIGCLSCAPRVAVATSCSCTRTLLGVVVKGMDGKTVAQGSPANRIQGGQRQIW